ncbi:hypothetical protein L1049_028206 [Liquidambar formosana]|uniref:Uncharacterized protein n=1 Tax=Liquidambar formosana TaxID=63359 RepID=A0AAP0WW76_LIQFO
MSSPSPTRSRDDRSSKGEERPRSFDAKARSLCWAKAETVPGRHPERWRKDAAGNIVCKRFWSCYGCLCFDQAQVESKAQSNPQWGWAKPSLKYPELALLSDKELDVIEMAVYGDVIRPGNQCRCRTVAEMLGQYKSKNPMAACKLPSDDESLKQTRI